MTRRSARRPAPKKQDDSNVYYDDELSDVFEDPIDDNDDDSDEDPTFEADEDAFEDPSYDEPLEEEEEDDTPSLGAKRKVGSAFSSSDFSAQPSKLQRTYNADAGWTSNPQPHVPHSMSASFRLNSNAPTPPMQAGRPTPYFASSASPPSSYSSGGGGSGASITSCPPPLSQPNPSMTQQSYPQQGQSAYPGSSYNASGHDQNRTSGGYPYRPPLQPGGRTPTAQQQHAASAYAAYSNRGMAGGGGYPGSQMNAQHAGRSGYPPQMNSYGGTSGYPTSGYPPQQQNPRFNGAGPGPTHHAEPRVRELLNAHHNRSKVQGVPHDISLAQLKREISNDPDLIEALKLIRLRASQRTSMGTPGRPGMPYGAGQSPNPNSMHRTFGAPMYGQAGSGQGEMSNATIPASMRNAMSSNRYHSSYGVPAHNYQVTGGMNMPMHGQTAQGQMAYGQNQQAGYGQYGQPGGSMMTSPMVKQTLNAEMANSLMQQTAGSDGTNPLNASTDNGSQQDDLDQLSGTEKRIETIMRKCEGISRQLRESLQKHLKSLLDDGKAEDKEGEEEKDEEGNTKPSQPLSTVSMESILRSSTDTLSKSEKKSQSVDNGQTNPGEEGSTLDEDLEQAMEENKPEGDNSDYYIVREQPSILRFALKEYQLVGLNWLNLLHLENVNGILADEMGLGKTIQTISLFALLHERKTAKHPHIVICPVTTLTNWMRELQKWCPSLRVIAYYGKKAERDEARKIIGNEHFDVIITTYNTAAQKSDRLFLKRNKFDYVVLDEAQNIKNNQSLRHKYLAKLDSRNRLLLTGTPLQNNLEELWALLQFIMPDLFSSEVNLEEETDKELAERLVSRMKVIMAPFVLRRLKQHVSQDLPAKELKIIECPMTDLQRDLYRACVQQSKTWWQKNQTGSESAKQEAKKEVKQEEEAVEEDYSKSTIDTDCFLSDDVVGAKTEETTPESVKEEDASTEVPSDATEVKEEATAKPKTEGSDDPLAEEDGESSDEEGLMDEDDEAYTGTKSKTAPQATSRKTRSRTMQSDDEDDELQELMRGTPASSVSSMNNIFMQLRKISNHPLLVRAFYTDEQVIEIARYLSSLDDYRKQTVDRIFEDLQEYSDFRIHQLCKDKEPLRKYLLNDEKLESCGKALQLKAVLAELKQNGHRVLLFSQMTRVLSILEDLITMWGYQYVRLDGNTPVTERQVLIDRYNDEPDTLFIFLLSTRAGGVGINLTSADTVIFYDIAFNPQVDRQAEDRCHRLGQLKEVTIYKMITTETVDEHMLRMADRKAQLNDVMLEEGSKKKDNTKVWALRSLLSSVFE